MISCLLSAITTSIWPGSARLSFSPWNLLLFIVVAVLLTGCAVRRDQSIEPQSVAALPWQLFTERPNPAGRYDGYHFKASLNYIAPERKNRVLLDLWGNDPHPVRLDVYAGVGVQFALWLESSDGWLSYYPGQNTAYFGETAVDPTSASQQSFPFTLRELSLLWSGAVSNLVPAKFLSAEPLTQGGFRYAFPDGDKVTSLSLDSEGFPLQMSGSDPMPWELVFKGWEDHNGFSMPDKLTLHMQPNARAIVRIKDRSLLNNPWPQRALELEPPEDARYIRLEGFAPDANLLCPTPEKQ